MPCYDGGPREPTISQERLDEFRRIEAMLCAMFKTAEKLGWLPTLMENIDWKAAGIKRYQMEEWWVYHKAADELRRQQEAEEAERLRKIKSAKSKLTNEERKLLGIK